MYLIALEGERSEVQALAEDGTQRSDTCQSWLADF